MCSCPGVPGCAYELITACNSVGSDYDQRIENQPVGVVKRRTPAGKVVRMSKSNES